MTIQIELEKLYVDVNLRKFIDTHILANQSALIYHLIERVHTDPSFEWEFFENDCVYIDKDGEDCTEEESWIHYKHKEIRQCFLVDSYLANILKDHKECVLDNEYGCWWGRQSDTQYISTDDIIQKIYLETLTEEK